MPETKITGCIADIYAELCTARRKAEAILDLLHSHLTLTDTNMALATRGDAAVHAAILDDYLAEMQDSLREMGCLLEQYGLAVATDEDEWYERFPVGGSE